MVTREELYALVWSIPMTKVADQFGVSGSYMARICTFLNVPRPERGYWAKLAHNKAPPQQMLPEALPGDPLIWGKGQDITALPVPRPPQQRTTRKAIRGIHPLIENGRSHYLHVRPGGNDHHFLKPFKRLMLDVTATRTGLDKALKFASDLFNALESLGYRVTLAPAGMHFQRPSIKHREIPSAANDYEHSGLWCPERPTLVYVDTVAIGVSIIEMTEEITMGYVGGKYIREADYSPPKSAKFNDHSWTTTKEIPCGRLKLQLFAPYRNVGWSCEFNETKQRTLTADIPAIVRAIEESAVAMVGRLEEAARQEQEWQRQRLEEERRWREEEDRRKIAKSKSDSHEQLIEVINAWMKAINLENFFQNVENCAADLGESDAEKIHVRLRLAREFVGSPDPLAFFLEWKTPVERYVPIATRTEISETDHGDD
jgi:hypothetical protein